MLAFVLTACQDNDIERKGMVLSPISADQITGAMQGDNYVLTWNALPAEQSMQVKIYRNGTLDKVVENCVTSCIHEQVPTNVSFEYVLKVTDGTNYSSGVIKTFIREGASSINGLQMSQVEKANGYDAKIEWDKAEDATKIYLSATNGTRSIYEELAGSAIEYTISDVYDGDTWEVSLTAENDKGKSLPTTSSLRIGKTAIGFLSEYATPDELIENGDDDEASAWLWLHEEYPTAQYLYFGDITSAADLEQFRVLFWLRDLEGVGADEVWTMSDEVMAATPFIQEWYKAGGSLLLWSHATPYLGFLGRIECNTLRSYNRDLGTGIGGKNDDTWRMAVELKPGKSFSLDFSTHPIYKGLETEIDAERQIKVIPMKGPGWTEDHNCLYFDIPSVFTGLGNQEQACYTTLTSEYGIYPLGTWDGQYEWISQLNVWEAQQGNTEFKGTILCIGNGGCEFSMKNADGTPDKRAHPKNNKYQDNILKLAKNSLEYLKTR